MMRTIGNPCSKVCFCYLKEPINPCGRQIGFFTSRNKLAHLGLLHLIRDSRYRAVLPVLASSESQLDLETAEAEKQELDESKTVRIKFQLQKECSFGEQFLIVGDDPIVGLWDPESAIPLIWSDAHVWTVELDIPIGKSIQFKFLLKKITGEILWQPGPDRVLQTWETANRIVVWEYWEDAASQKVMVEELVANETEEANANSEMIVAENLESLSSVNKETSIADINPHQVENEKPIVANNVVSSPEEHTAIVADNISYPKEDPAVNLVDKVQTEKEISHQISEPVANAGTNVALVGDNIGNNDRAPVENLQSTKVTNTLVTYEGDPVLVPGLLPLSVMPNAEVIQDEGKTSIASDVSHEVDNQNMPELAEKHEIVEDPHQEEIKEVVNELKQKPIEKEEQQDHSEESSLFQSDIQWGRQTIQKLLSNLGLLKH